MRSLRALGSRMDPELRKRVATGVVGGAALLAVIVWGGRLGSALLALGLTLGSLREFLGMTLALPDRREKTSIVLGTAWLVAVANFLAARAEYELFVFAFIGLFAFFLISASRHEGEALREHFVEFALSVVAVVYLAFIPLYLPLIRDSSGGVHWTIVFLLTVWAGDSGAYFVGKKYGRRKLYSAISPKKTLEGAVGGLLAGLVVVLVYKLALFRAMSWGAVVPIALGVGISSQVGDLCESLLKRAYRKKDSGSILPGHGGILDRFDGVLFGLPVMYACMRVFG